MLKTKIIATITPQSIEDDLLKSMIDAGVDVFRLNFSHGSRDEHRRMIREIKKIREGLAKPVAILQDISGAKVRTGSFNEPQVELLKGQGFVLFTSSETEGSVEGVYVDHQSFADEVREGDQVILDDGKVAMKVAEISDGKVFCEITKGGTVRGRRGVSVPGKILSNPAITEKDKLDIKLGLEEGVDFIALSFVREEKDVRELRSFINENVMESLPDVIAKIETAKALDNFNDIMDTADAVMIARGDLAVETEPENIPMEQKRMIAKANEQGKPVITATQMLESMVNLPTPTRAETSDVANAVLDGTDAVMLSSETSIGKYPLEAINAVAKTALRVEKNYPTKIERKGDEKTDMGITDSITTAVVAICRGLDAKLIVALTDSGFTGRMISRHKPKTPIVAMATDKYVYRKLSLSFGCVPLYVEPPEDVGKAFDTVRDRILARGFAEEGDRVVVAAGAPFELPGAKTNMLFVESL
ncbi:MAG: pyruvate kinase [Candidatus Paceibacterota bacterium]